ncbi:hypothetical protein B0A48_05674 [Cryoendolithus antarcticus]|uniref:Uncharacterized protein n=1 Tax=Cryoendolithus antarcticus TaxID=1507870 RepID=A0A1V8TBX9_9PEZI|nr:hypothetical protein B0A48_05674 [Cryoendolithus antarcticus]
MTSPTADVVDQTAADGLSASAKGVKSSRRRAELYTSCFTSETINEPTKCIIFLNALEKRFAMWITHIGSVRNIAGAGPGPELSYDQLRDLAYDYWVGLRRAEEQIGHPQQGQQDPKRGATRREREIARRRER